VIAIGQLELSFFATDVLWCSVCGYTG